MARYITHLDGSIEFPRKGYPPDIIPGYDQDPKNPYKFIPIIPECKFREIREHMLVCGKKRPYFHCLLKDIQVSRNYCAQCKEYQK